jgi:hypothetical protein
MMTLQARNTTAAKIKAEGDEQEQRAQLLRGMAIRRARYAALEANPDTRKKV